MSIVEKVNGSQIANVIKDGRIATPVLDEAYPRGYQGRKADKSECNPSIEEWARAGAEQRLKDMREGLWLPPESRYW